MSETLFKPFLALANAATPQESLESLIETSKTKEGRTKLVSKNILLPLIRLCRYLHRNSSKDLLLLALDLFKNLSEVEVIETSLDLFRINDGFEILVSILDDSDLCVVRKMLEVFGKMAIANESFRIEIWERSFPEKLTNIANMKRIEISDTLCKVLCGCSFRISQLQELGGEDGLPIIETCILTALASFEDGVSAEEEGLLMLLSRICVVDNFFPRIFSRLFNLNDNEYTVSIGFDTAYFVKEQAFLLRKISKIFVQPEEIEKVSPYFATCVFEILKRAAKLVDGLPNPQSGLPTGSTNIDVMGYSLMIMRIICDTKNKFPDVLIELLLSSGLLGVLLSMLSDLGPPKKSEKCPYKGCRVDIVATIGSCLFQRHHVQADVRERNKIGLLVQQCVDDDQNEGLRTHGISTVKNLVEGNRLNRRLVTELEGSDDIPEISDLLERIDKLTLQPN